MNTQPIIIIKLYVWYDTKTCCLGGYIFMFSIVKMGKCKRKCGRAGVKGHKRKSTTEATEGNEGGNHKTPASSDNGTDEPRWNPGHTAQSKLDPDKSWAPKCKSKFM